MARREKEGGGWDEIGKKGEDLGVGWVGMGWDRRG